MFWVYSIFQKVQAQVSKYGASSLRLILKILYFHYFVLYTCKLIYLGFFTYMFETFFIFERQGMALFDGPLFNRFKFCIHEQSYNSIPKISLKMFLQNLHKLKFNKKSVISSNSFEATPSQALWPVCTVQDWINNKRFDFVNAMCHNFW